MARRHHSHHRRRERPFHIRLWEKLRYGKNRGIYYGAIWALFFLFALPIIEGINQEAVLSIGYIILIPSAIIGFYAAYPIIMWIDKRLSNSYFGVWMRRVVSSFLVLAGFGLSLMWLLSFTLAMTLLAARGSSLGGAVSAMALSCTIIAFFCGVGFFAGYLEYVFERKSGILVFTGRQRF